MSAAAAVAPPIGLLSSVTPPLDDNIPSATVPQHVSAASVSASTAQLPGSQSAFQSCTGRARAVLPTQSTQMPPCVRMALAVAQQVWLWKVAETENPVQWLQSPRSSDCVGDDIPSPTAKHEMGPSPGMQISSHGPPTQGLDGLHYIEVHHQGAVRWLCINSPQGEALLTLEHEPAAEAEKAAPKGARSLQPVRALTLLLGETYQACNPEFKYSKACNPRRPLTFPCEVTQNERDNKDHDLVLFANDLLQDPKTSKQYKILDLLGSGTFGQVVQCEDLDTNGIVAIKVVKNKPAYHKQAIQEVRTLRAVTEHQTVRDRHTITLQDQFVHHNHLCIVFEALNINLYELLRQNKHRGLSTNLIRVILVQILDCLTMLWEIGVIHCDLKPENILLCNDHSPQIKVIDFGSACFVGEQVYSYIQSRFYRSPEVILGLSYTQLIDQWSLGCIAAELFLGLPLFPGHSEHDQLHRIVDMIGPIPATLFHQMARKKSEKFCHFENQAWRLMSSEEYAQKHGVVEARRKSYIDPGTTLETLLTHVPRTPGSGRHGPPEGALSQEELDVRAAMSHFLGGLLTLEPQSRWSPREAAQHPFITKTEWTGYFSPEPDPSHPARQQPARQQQMPHELQQGLGAYMAPNMMQGMAAMAPGMFSFGDMYGGSLGYSPYMSSSSSPAGQFSYTPVMTPFGLTYTPSFTPGLAGLPAAGAAWGNSPSYVPHTNDLPSPLLRTHSEGHLQPSMQPKVGPPSQTKSHRRRRSLDQVPDLNSSAPDIIRSHGVAQGQDAPYDTQGGTAPQLPPPQPRQSASQGQRRGHSRRRKDLDLDILPPGDTEEGSPGGQRSGGSSKTATRRRAHSQKQPSPLAIDRNKSAPQLGHPAPGSLLAQACQEASRSHASDSSDGGAEVATSGSGSDNPSQDSIGVHKPPVMPALGDSRSQSGLHSRRRKSTDLDQLLLGRDSPAAADEIVASPQGGGSSHKGSSSSRRRRRKDILQPDFLGESSPSSQSPLPNSSHAPSPMSLPEPAEPKGQSSRERRHTGRGGSNRRNRRRQDFLEPEILDNEPPSPTPQESAATIAQPATEVATKSRGSRRGRRRNSNELDPLGLAELGDELRTKSRGSQHSENSTGTVQEMGSDAAVASSPEGQEVSAADVFACASPSNAHCGESSHSAKAPRPAMLHTDPPGTSAPPDGHRPRGGSRGSEGSTGSAVGAGAALPSPGTPWDRQNSHAGRKKGHHRKRSSLDNFLPVMVPQAEAFSGASGSEGQDDSVSPAVPAGTHEAAQRANQGLFLPQGDAGDPMTAMHTAMMMQQVQVQLMMQQQMAAAMVLQQQYQQQQYQQQYQQYSQQQQGMYGLDGTGGIGGMDPALLQQQQQQMQAMYAQMAGAQQVAMHPAMPPGPAVHAGMQGLSETAQMQRRGSNLDDTWAMQEGNPQNDSNIQE